MFYSHLLAIAALTHDSNFVLLISNAFFICNSILNLDTIVGLAQEEHIAIFVITMFLLISIKLSLLILLLNAVQITFHLCYCLLLLKHAHDHIIRCL